MPDPIKPKEIAKFAAEGVAIALSARDASFRGPVHIICGIPPDVFKVEYWRTSRVPCARGKSRNIKQEGNRDA